MRNLSSQISDPHYSAPLRKFLSERPKKYCSKTIRRLRVVVILLVEAWQLRERQGIGVTVSTATQPLGAQTRVDMAQKAARLDGHFTPVCLSTMILDSCISLI
jgi:hypothetical protein